MKRITDVDVARRRVLVRCDVNVPLDDGGRITDDSRIRAALPTIAYLLENGAAIILASHLGRPKGTVRPEFSLRPVAERLRELLDRPVDLATDCVGLEVQALAGKLRAGQVLVLENLRFHAAEEANEDGFGRRLAQLADVYVNDAFAVCHRSHASVVAVTRHAACCAAGCLLQKELDAYDKALTRPVHPLAAVVGGAKVSSKLRALENMLRRCDKVIVGGAMANTFLKATGLAVGASMVENDLVAAADELLRKAADQGCRVYLPVDVVAAERVDPAAVICVAPVQEIPQQGMALDIGPATAQLFRTALQDAGTIVWNGPMGVFEEDAFARGTMALARCVAASAALTIVGGGDTVSAVHKAGEGAGIDYMSTGGGAFLTLMEGRSLPAVTALQDACQDR